MASKEYHKAYNEANKEKIKNQRKAYREANKEKIKVKQKAFYEANKEKIKVRQKAFYEANKEKIKARTMVYRKANRGKIKDWYKSNKDKVYAYCVKRRALKMDGYEELNADDKFVIEECYELMQLRTTKMGFAWHVDHIKPLSKGGKHHPNNLQVVPATWNLRKNNNHQEKWVG